MLDYIWFFSVCCSVSYSLLLFFCEILHGPCCVVCIVQYTSGFAVLEWGRANFAPVDSWVCAGAAIAGRLDVVQWCRKRLLPWNDDTMAGALAARHKHVVKWCLEHGCPCRGGTRVQALGFLNYTIRLPDPRDQLAARFEGLVS